MLILQTTIVSNQANYWNFGWYISTETFADFFSQYNSNKVPTSCNLVRTRSSKWPKYRKIDTCYVTFSLSFVWYESNRKKMLKEYFEFNAQELTNLTPQITYQTPLIIIGQSLWLGVQCLVQITKWFIRLKSEKTSLFQRISYIKIILLYQDIFSISTVPIL